MMNSDEMIDYLWTAPEQIATRHAGAWAGKRARILANLERPSVSWMRRESADRLGDGRDMPLPKTSTSGPSLRNAQADRARAADSIVEDHLAFI